MPNFSSLARLEVPEKFVWWVVGGVCKVIFMSNPTVVLRLGWGWGFDNICVHFFMLVNICHLITCGWEELEVRLSSVQRIAGAWQ